MGNVYINDPTNNEFILVADLNQAIKQVNEFIVYSKTSNAAFF